MHPSRSNAVKHYFPAAHHASPSGPARVAVLAPPGGPRVATGCAATPERRSFTVDLARHELRTSNEFLAAAPEGEAYLGLSSARGLARFFLDLAEVRVHVVVRPRAHAAFM